MIGIYCITNKINGKKYVGQSINVERRLDDHFKKGRHNNHLKNAINKYGIDNFEIEILKVCEIRYLDRFEKLYIRKWDLMNPDKGYNKTNGGEGVSIEYFFQYTVAKRGFDQGKQVYCIYDMNNRPIKTSYSKKKLDDIAAKLNTGLLTEEEIKSFNFTVVKTGCENGKQKYCICNKDHRKIKTSIDKKALNFIAKNLNTGNLTEKQVKSVKGIKKILDMLEN